MKEILDAIKTSILEIEKAIKFPELGYTNSHNKTGDTQLKLDVKSDEIITKNLSQVSSIKAIISEEKDEILTLNENAEFIVAYDPLDGSSLVDVNFAVGSIFGIYRGEVGALNLVASAYSVYGPRLEMVVCGFDESENKIKTPPTLYRVDENSQFIKIRELVLNEKGKLNATGGSQWGWGEKHKLLVKTLFDEKYRLRYSGAMVADLHQILLKGGGLFSYPATSDSPNGKLRVTFEILPFAYIFESAGGTTSDGVLDSLLELEFSKIHSTSPCFFGSKYEIEKMHEIYGLKG